MTVRVIRTAATVVALASATAVAITVPVASASAATQPRQSVLTDIRVGRHATYDRVVLDFRGAAPGAAATRWVARLTADPSDRPIPLPGKRFLVVVEQNAAAHDAAGHGTYRGRATFTTPQLRNVRAVALAGDFEGVLSVGLGVTHTAWVHTFTLSNPSRLVVDVGR
jgi:hypothetical protein